MIRFTIFLLPLALLTACVSTQSSSISNTPIPSSVKVLATDISGTLSRTHSSDTSSALSGIPLTSAVSGRQNATATTSTTTLEVTAIIGLSPSTDSTNDTASAT